jgi:hypothetical protein
LNPKNARARLFNASVNSLSLERAVFVVIGQKLQFLHFVSGYRDEAAKLALVIENESGPKSIDEV